MTQVWADEHAHRVLFTCSNEATLLSLILVTKTTQQNKRWDEWRYPVFLWPRDEGLNTKRNYLFQGWKKTKSLHVDSFLGIELKRMSSSLPAPHVAIRLFKCWFHLSMWVPFVDTRYDEVSIWSPSIEWRWHHWFDMSSLISKGASNRQIKITSSKIHTVNLPGSMPILLYGFEWMTIRLSSERGSLDVTETLREISHW